MTGGATGTYPPLQGLVGKKIVLVATGALGTALLPTWLEWIRHAAPETEFRLVLTRSASRFVGLAAIRAFMGKEPIIDDWAGVDVPLHVELAQWAEGFLVHPATMHFVSRLSAGLCDSPTLLAIQGTCVPVVVAAAAPPGFIQSPVWGQYRRALGERENVTLLDPAAGYSAFDPTLKGSPAAVFSDAAAVLAARITESGAPSA